MRSLLRRLRHGRITTLEGELLAARPQPPKPLVESIVAMVGPRAGPGRHVCGSRSRAA